MGARGGLVRLGRCNGVRFGSLRPPVETVESSSMGSNRRCTTVATQGFAEVAALIRHNANPQPPDFRSNPR